jgi:hypothetical protein
MTEQPAEPQYDLGNAFCMALDDETVVVVTPEDLAREMEERTGQSVTVVIEDTP